MTIQQLMQKWEFNHIIPYEYSNVMDLVAKADGTLLLMLAEKCHLPHYTLMYAYAMWADYGYKKWLSDVHHKYVKDWIENAQNIYNHGLIMNQSDLLCAKAAVSEVYNYINAHNSIGGSNEKLKLDYTDFSYNGGRIVESILGVNVIVSLVKQLEDLN